MEQSAQLKANTVVAFAGTGHHENLAVEKLALVRGLAFQGQVFGGGVVSVTGLGGHGGDKWLAGESTAKNTAWQTERPYPPAKKRFRETPANRQPCRKVRVWPLPDILFCRTACMNTHSGGKIPQMRY